MLRVIFNRLKKGSYNAELLSVSQSGDVKRVEELCELGADPNCAGSLSKTPLHHAAQRGRVDVLVALIRAGAKVDGVCTELNNMSPLHFAVEGKHRAVIEALLLAGANPNARADCDLTPLHFAADKGDAETAKLLLQAGADPRARTYTPHGDGATPVDQARAHVRVYPANQAILDVLVAALGSRE